MKYTITIIVILAFCLPAHADILVFKTATTGQQLDVANKIVEKKKEGGYLVINANLSNTNSITVSEAQYLHFETKAGMKVQYTTIPSDVDIIMVDYGKGKKMILRCFDISTGTYIVINGNALLKDIGGILRYAAANLSGSSVWQQLDFRTGSGTTKLLLDTMATKTANLENKTVESMIDGFSQSLTAKGYNAE
jgi:hypothetical protein